MKKIRHYEHLSKEYYKGPNLGNGPSYVDRKLQESEDCDLIMWEFLKIQKIYYEQPQWTKFDLENILYQMPPSDWGKVTTLSDLKLCMGAMGRIENAEYNRFQMEDDKRFPLEKEIMNPFFDYQQKKEVFREEFLEPINRFLCYRQASYYDRQGIDIFHNVNNQSSYIS